MGAAPEDYARLAPHHSYIHVDDWPSPQALADHLHKVDKNDTLYNEYFAWRKTGEFINTFFFCRLCSMLHSQGRPKHYTNINEWWRSHGTCIAGSWRDQKQKRKPYVTQFDD